MEDDRFCTQCGARIPPDASFCTECGAYLNATGPAPDTQRIIVRKGPSFAPIILIYGVFALLLGIVDMANGMMMTEQSYNDMIQQVTDMTGMDASGILPAWTANTGLLMTLSMACLAVSGAAAIFCYILCRKGDNWKAAVILCAASSIACAGICCYSLYAYIGLPLLAIGAIVTFLLYGSKDSFNN